MSYGPRPSTSSRPTSYKLTVDVSARSTFGPLCFGQGGPRRPSQDTLVGSETRREGMGRTVRTRPCQCEGKGSPLRPQKEGVRNRTHPLPSPLARVLPCLFLRASGQRRGTRGSQTPTLTPDDHRDKPRSRRGTNGTVETAKRSTRPLRGRGLGKDGTRLGVFGPGAPVVGGQPRRVPLKTVLYLRPRLAPTGRTGRHPWPRTHREGARGPRGSQRG